MKLFDLTKNYNTLLEMLDNEGLEQQAIIDTLESIEGDITDKAENIAKMIRTIEHQEESLREEEIRLSARRKGYESHRHSMRGYLESQMLQMGKDKIKSTLFTIYIGNNPPSVNIYDEVAFKADLDIDLVDKLYIPQPAKLDKRELLEMLKTGTKFFGVTLEQGRSLKIR